MWGRLGLLLVLLLLPACAGGADSDAGQDDSAAYEQSAEGTAEEAAAPVGGGGDGESGEGGSTSDLGSVTAAASGDRVIKDGTVILEVDEDGFDVAFGRVVTAAERLGGSVVSSTTTNAAGQAPAGSVTIRVPVDAFERVLAEVGEFGTVRDRRVTSEDVSTEYVDLEARLRQAQAQERFYLRLLDDAQDIEDAIAVQQQLNSLQTEIERLKGRLQFLDDRTAFSTLTVEIYEPGAPPILAQGSDQPSFARYWRQAREMFVAVTGAMLVTMFALLPLLIPLAIAFAVWRIARARTSRPRSAASD